MLSCGGSILSNAFTDPLESEKVNGGSGSACNGVWTAGGLGFGGERRDVDLLVGLLGITVVTSGVTGVVFVGVVVVVVVVACFLKSCPGELRIVVLGTSGGIWVSCFSSVVDRLLVTILLIAISRARSINSYTTM